MKILIVYDEQSLRKEALEDVLSLVKDQADIFIKALSTMEVALAGYDHVVVLQEKGAETPVLSHPHMQYFDLPIRAGVLLDHIQKLVQISEQKGALGFGPYHLDMSRFVLENTEGAAIKLTEKEAALLALLGKAEGAPVAKDTILEAVWGYKEELETHTLETHIYRLRQKIEHDPSNPGYLKTMNDGYCLVTD